MKGSKLANSLYEDDIIYWINNKGLSCLEVHNKLKDLKYKVSYQTIVYYIKNILPDVSEDRIKKIVDHRDEAKVNKEVELTKRISDLSSSIDYLSKMQENLDSIDTDKNNIIKQQGILELVINDLTIKLEEIRVKKEKEKVETILTQLDMDEKAIIDKLYRQKNSVIDLIDKKMQLISLSEKLVKTMQSIRTDINKILGETWNDKIREIVDYVVSGIFDVMKYGLEDDSKVKITKDLTTFIKRCYERYGIKDNRENSTI